MNGDAVEIVVIAIGRNEGARLQRCLRSIPAGIKTIYVDSQSTDGSIELASSHGAEVVQLDMTRPFTAARARNAGLSALDDKTDEESGSTMLVQFVDGDCEIEPHWLERAAEFLKMRPEVVVVCGRRRERFPEASVYNRLCDAEWDTPLGRSDACGGDAMMRVTALRAVGGYNDVIVAGEEPEMCARLRGAGGEIWRIDAPMTLHDAAILHLSQWWRRTVRGGFGYAQVWRTNGLYSREVKRAVCWAGALPLAALLLAVAWSPWGLLTLLLPIAQAARIALRHGGGVFAWQRATLLMLAKIAELQGIVIYGWQASRARLKPPTSYK